MEEGWSETLYSSAYSFISLNAKSSTTTPSPAQQQQRWPKKGGITTDDWSNLERVQSFLGSLNDVPHLFFNPLSKVRHLLSYFSFSISFRLDYLL